MSVFAASHHWSEPKTTHYYRSFNVGRVSVQYEKKRLSLFLTSRESGSRQVLNISLKSHVTVIQFIWHQESDSFLRQPVNRSRALPTILHSKASWFSFSRDSRFTVHANKTSPVTTNIAKIANALLRYKAS